MASYILCLLFWWLRCGDGVKGTCKAIDNTGGRQDILHGVHHLLLLGRLGCGSPAASGCLPGSALPRTHSFPLLRHAGFQNMVWNVAFITVMVYNGVYLDVHIKSKWNTLTCPRHYHKWAGWHPNFIWLALFYSLLAINSQKNFHKYNWVGI